MSEDVKFYSSPPDLVLILVRPKRAGKGIMAGTNNFFTMLGRTNLRIGVSGAKFDAEADFEFRLPLAPPKPCQNYETYFFWANFPKCFKIFRKRPKLFGRHLNLSECIRTCPSRSEQVENLEKLAKTSKKSRNFAKMSKTIAKLTKFLESPV